MKMTFKINISDELYRKNDAVIPWYQSIEKSKLLNFPREWLFCVCTIFTSKHWRSFRFLAYSMPLWREDMGIQQSASGSNVIESTVQCTLSNNQTRLMFWYWSARAPLGTGRVNICDWQAFVSRLYLAAYYAMIVPFWKAMTHETEWVDKLAAEESAFHLMKLMENSMRHKRLHQTLSYRWYWANRMHRWVIITIIPFGSITDLT